MRKNVLRSIGAAVVATGLVGTAVAYPGGTRPTMMTSSARSVNSSTMEVSGKITDLSGHAVAGLRVDVLVLYPASDSRWATGYSGSSGDFKISMPKPPAGSKMTLDVAGNGAYGRPLQVFGRP
ncbi:MAG: hypothetical protein U0573_14800 [Phycisphaerales bacterium]|nr:hypothetical protein [Planctomycetota bacterium]